MKPRNPEGREGGEPPETPPVPKTDLPGNLRPRNSGKWPGGPSAKAKSEGHPKGGALGHSCHHRWGRPSPARPSRNTAGSSAREGPRGQAFQALVWTPAQRTHRPTAPRPCRIGAQPGLFAMMRKGIPRPSLRSPVAPALVSSALQTRRQLLCTDRSQTRNELVPPPLLPEPRHPTARSAPPRGVSQPATGRKGAPRAPLEMDGTPEAQVLGPLLSCLPLLPTGTRL